MTPAFIVGYPYTPYPDNFPTPEIGFPHQIGFSYNAKLASSGSPLTVSGSAKQVTVCWGR
jgi:hypothetical protein